VAPQNPTARTTQGDLRRWKVVTKEYVKPAWYKDVSRQQICYFAGGMYEIGTLIEDKPEIIINRLAYEELLDFIRKNEHGILSTDRTEDLKIIHRLLDVLEREAKP
jgi:hypothetical protein